MKTKTYREMVTNERPCYSTAIRPVYGFNNKNAGILKTAADILVIMNFLQTVLFWLF
jgi:hypothetical protein